jgi:molybdopterin synthase sulfur carrier subunit
MRAITLDVRLRRDIELHEPVISLRTKFSDTHKFTLALLSAVWYICSCPHLRRHHAGGAVTVIDTGTVRVAIPAGLLGRTGNRRWVHVCAATVREIIDALERDFPGLKFNLCYETGEVRKFVNIFVGPEECRYLDGLDTVVPSGVPVRIIHSVAGG